MRDLILLIEALNTALADATRPIYQWGDCTNDGDLSRGFAWLINTVEPDQDAAACIQTADFDEYKGPPSERPMDGPCEWTVYPHFGAALDGGRPRFRSSRTVIKGQAPSMEAAKRACEEALGFPHCGQHGPRGRGNHPTPQGMF